MLSVLLRRLAWMIPTFFVISAGLFGLVNLAPPLVPTGEDDAPASAESVIAFRRQFNLDAPLFLDTAALAESGPTAEAVRATLLDTRFAAYWRNLARLDFGVSSVSRRPVRDVVAERLGVTVTLSLVSILCAWAIAVPLGVWSAVRVGTRADRVVSVVLFALTSLPSFFVATVLLAVFAGELRLFPLGDFASLDPPASVGGRLADVAWHLALPVATSTAVALAALSRYARVGVLEVLGADHVRAARARGLGERAVLVRHVLRNGVTPLLTLLGGTLPALVSGNVVIEVIFNLPGLGAFLVESIGARDYNAVMAVLLASAALTLVGVLLSDLLAALADPRVELG